MSQIVFSRRRSLLLPALLLAATVALSGCASEITVSGAGSTGADVTESSEPTTESQRESPTSEAGDQAEPTWTEVEMPEDFPSVVPLPDGELTAASAHTLESGSGHWVLQYRADFTEADFSSLRQELVEKGFVEQTSGGAEGQILMSHHANDQYMVNLGLKWQDDGQLLQVAVSERDD